MGIAAAQQEVVSIGGACVVVTSAQDRVRSIWTMGSLRKTTGTIIVTETMLKVE